MEMVRRIEWRRNWFIIGLVVGVLLYAFSGPLDEVNARTDAPGSGLLSLAGPIGVGLLFFGVVGILTLVAARVLGPIAAKSATNRRLMQGLGAAILLLAFVFLPWYYDIFPYATLYKLTIALQWVMVIIGINLLTGYTGQISLGQGAFFAIGGYTLGIASFHEWSLPWAISLLIAPVITGILGFLVGIPSLRLKGPYLALATLAFAVIVMPIAKRFEEFTGGVQGIAMFGKIKLWDVFADHSDYFWYYLSLAAAVLMLVFVWNIMHGRIGRALIAIRDNEIAASAMGVNVALYKTTVFGIAAAFAGFAGAVNAAVIQFASPDQYSTLVSIRVFVGAVIGGVASVPGAVFGGLFTQFIPDIAADVSKAAADAVQAVILIVFMYAMRGGFAGFVVQTWHYGRRGVQLLRPAASREPATEASAAASAPSPSGSE